MADESMECMRFPRERRGGKRISISRTSKNMNKVRDRKKNQLWGQKRQSRESFLPWK